MTFYPVNLVEATVDRTIGIERWNEMIELFQGRHKRNATFPGGQTTILQVTPTIRSK